MGKGEKNQNMDGTDSEEIKEKRISIENKVAPKDDDVISVETDMERERKSANEAMERLRQRREQKPLFYCKLVTKYPLRSFLLTLSAHILMVVISVILLAAGYDLLPVDFENLPLELNDLPWRPRDIAWRYRNTFGTYYDRDPISGYRVNSYQRANIDLYFDGDGANVFTKTHFEKIQEIENRLTSVPDYANKYCQLNVNLTACEKPTSIIRYFDGTFASINPMFNDPTFSNIPGVLYEAYTNNDTASSFRYFLGQTHEITQTSAFSGITRSVIPIGFPLAGYNDDTDGYEREIRDFSRDHMKPILEEIRENEGLFDFVYRSELLWVEDVFNQAMKDVLCAVGSICFIFLFILIHTKSLWIAGFAILSIITSFVTTNLIYRVVLDFRYIGFFHILTLFIVLGIGADDIFVFYDVWRNTGFEDYPSLAHRLSDAYRKSVFSMLFTSITTAVAFFASTISPLLATRSFGVFSGLVVLVNYLSVIIYFPTVVIMFHTRYEHFRWPCMTFIKRQLGKVCKCCLPNSDIRSEGSTKVTTISGEPTQYCMADGVNGTAYENNGPVYGVNGIGNGVTNGHVNGINQGDVKMQPLFTSLTDKRQSLDYQNCTATQNGHLFKTEIIIDKSGDRIIEKRIRRDSETSNGYVNSAFEADDVNNIKANGVGGFAARTISEDKPVRYGIFKKRKQKSLMVRFFREKYFAFVTNNYCRVLILLVVAGVLAFFVYQATRLEPDNQGLRVLKDTHVYSIARDHGLYSFVQSDADRTITVYIAWGMYQNDMSDCHFSTPKCYGKKVWDYTFNPNTPEAQLAVKNLCGKMKNFTAEEAYRYRIKSDFTTGEYQIDCYIDNLKVFLDAETSLTGVDWGLYYNFTKSVEFMDNRTAFYNSSGFTNAYEDYLEAVDTTFWSLIDEVYYRSILQIPISDWLSNKQTYQYNNDFFVFDPLIGEELGPFSRSIKNNTIRKYGNKIKYVAIQVNTTLKAQTLGYSEGIPIMDDWERFVNEELQQMPSGMQNGFQFTQLIWHWLVVQEMRPRISIIGCVCPLVRHAVWPPSWGDAEDASLYLSTLVQNAIYGLIIGVCLAFPIFVIATRNIITGTLATLTICCSTVCVIGVIPLGGWKLGVLEALNMCMVVGLTVDYVVHLAEGYTLSLRTDRLSRVQDMLDEMAISIFFGACTTLGASMFMFIAQLSFFLQFGIFMFSTIGFSLFFSMLLFVTLMGIIGPQDNIGNIAVLCQNIHKSCKNS